MTQATETKIEWDKGIIIQEKEYRANDICLRARVELNKIHEHYQNIDQ